ncbi:probable protein phosphatase 2C 27 [Cryptomeria japonica]|uniref:probable protein phosphatase 2C 27 n=1 Tax=Cryptomeria japonica TaxID=3369 RepID=UPI0027DA11E2|nr:probable protein phosphatase 2C 27 [Cryptomeria japonica]
MNKKFPDSKQDQNAKLLQKTEISNEDKFMPVLRSGSCANIGQRKYMEDEHICVDNLSAYNLRRPAPAAAAFYGIFDGHSGGEASKYVKETILDLILDDPNFPNDVETAITNAFAATENGLRSAGILKAGTTALMVLVWGRTLFIANAGDCRAVLSRSGKHINMTTDHKPTNKDERLRIESRGGVISSDGYINGVNCQFGVSRGLGDWEFKLESVALNLLSPISADPELNTYELTQEDEFLIIASDGVWDVLKSDFAQEVVRKQLRLCNDPVKCSQELSEGFAMLIDEQQEPAVENRAGRDIDSVSLQIENFFRNATQIITLSNPQSVRQFFGDSRRFAVVPSNDGLSSEE